MSNLSTFDILNNKPIKFYDIEIYKPTLRDIAEMGEEIFSLVNSILTMTSDDLKDSFEQIYKDSPDLLKEVLNSEYTPYQYHLLQCSQGTADSLYFLELRLALFTYLKRDIVFSQGNLVAIGEKDTFVFSEENFSTLQSIVRQLTGIIEEKEEEIITDNLEMKKKFEERRKALKEAKRKERKLERENNPEEAIELGEIISCLCAYESGYNMLNIWDLTYSQLIDQFKRSQLKEDYSNKISLISGGRAGDQLKLTNWIKKITNN